MTELLLFASVYVSVFALGFQSQNVNQGHYKSAFLTSFAIGAGHLALYRLMPGASPSEVAAFLAGGPFGIVSSMYAHRQTLGRKTNGNHTPEKTRKWEADAKDQARAAMGGEPPLQGPLKVEVIAYFAPAQSWPDWKRQAALNAQIAHTSRPDADNIGKAAKDALNGVAWLDDCQVKRVIVDKRFSDQPRVEIFIRKTGQASSQVTRKDQIRSAS